MSETKRKQMWLSPARVLDDQHYKALHEYALAIAGDGEPVTSGDLGIDPHRIMWPERMLLVPACGERCPYDIVYSMSPECDLCVDLMDEFHKPANH